MPIEVRFEYGSRLIPLPEIKPLDPPGSFTNYGENPHLLVVSCNSDDSGGVVYKASTENSFTIYENQVRIIDPADAKVEAKLSAGGIYERGLQTKVGLGILVLRHYRPLS